MKWIRGKYNNLKIGGFRISFEINLFWWDWDFCWDKHSKNIHIGWLHLWILPAYNKKQQ